MKKITTRLSFAALAGSMLAASAPAMAEEVELSANVALTSNYIFRGFSQTDNAPAVQGGFDLAYSGFYAGVWASNVDSGFYAGSELEADLYVGYGGEINGISYDVGLLTFQYPDTTLNTNNTEEWHLGLGYDFGTASVGYTLYYSDNFFGAGSGERHELSLDVPVNDTIGVSLYYGTQDYGSTYDDYEDYGISVSAAVGGFDLTAAYTDTSGLTAGGANDTLAGDQFAFTVAKSF